MGKEILMVTSTELNKELYVENLPLLIGGVSNNSLSSWNKVILGNTVYVLFQNSIDGLCHTKEKVVFSVYFHIALICTWALQQVLWNKLSATSLLKPSVKLLSGILCIFSSCCSTKSKEWENWHSVWQRTAVWKACLILLEVFCYPNATGKLSLKSVAKMRIVTAAVCLSRWVGVHPTSAELYNLMLSIEMGEIRVDYTVGNWGWIESWEMHSTCFAVTAHIRKGTVL